jgi:hypothetical protein
MNPDEASEYVSNVICLGPRTTSMSSPSMWSPSEINYYNKYVIQQQPIFNENGTAHKDWIDHHNDEVRRNYPPEQQYLLYSFSMTKIDLELEKIKTQDNWIKDVLGKPQE